ncbi:BTAD domain-containing putative transcriptional regulator [Stackebrandtia soli]|uniref:AfsR/SARP family transcriptional regulator n=1 Tax=Stackebrandtia soli TaxID=1892856 RepID=UPI0039E95A80
MKYRILGPLDVSIRGHQLVLKGVRGPTFLASLLVNVGRVVSIERIVSTLWSDEPPATAWHQVLNLASGMRRALERAGAPGTLSRTQGGYRISVDPETIDVVQFDTLAVTARRLVADGRPDAAVAAFDEALVLWRGPALSGLRGSLVDSAAQTIEERRRVVIEERAEAQLTLGRYEEVINSARALLTEEPYRQRAAGLLMRALHHCGRTPEALEVYGEVRSRLVDQLGLEPGADLRSVHKSVLEPVKSETVRSSSRITVRVPAELPADASGFVGRSDLLAEVGTGSALIVGQAGVGKTALAVHWGHLHRERFPDGQLYVDLRGYHRDVPVSPCEALARFLRALGVDDGSVPAGVESATALYRSLLSDRRILVVLDNAGSAEQVRPLLPSGTGARALITSRMTLSGLVAREGVRLTFLDPLSHEESQRLLTGLVGAERIRADPDAARQLVELCGRLPLALRIAAANLIGDPALRLGDHVLALRSNRLAALAIDGDPEATLEYAFTLSYQRLTEPQRHLFRRLALLARADFTVGAVSAMTGEPELVTARLLQQLQRSNLIERRGTGSFRIHDLMRAFAHSKLANRDVVASGLTRDDPRSLTVSLP